MYIRECRPAHCTPPFISSVQQTDLQRAARLGGAGLLALPQDELIFLESREGRPWLCGPFEIQPNSSLSYPRGGRDRRKEGGRRGRREKQRGTEGFGRDRICVYGWSETKRSKPTTIPPTTVTRLVGMSMKVNYYYAIEQMLACFSKNMKQFNINDFLIFVRKHRLCP